MNILLIAIGLIVGLLLPKGNILLAPLKMLVFSIAVPYLILTEVSSMDIKQWPLFLYGAGFVLVLFYLGRRLSWDKHRSALLATAEGGTMGFVLYSTIGKESLSRYFLIDHLGNGGLLFSFIYMQIGNEYKIKEFFKNPLMIAMGSGLALNLFGYHLKEEVVMLKTIQPYVGSATTLLICAIVGADIELHLSRDIFLSRIYWSFWIIRIIGAALCIILKLPLALTVLFVLPPSMLLPIIYPDGTVEKRYASNFIAACLPISFILSIILYLAV